MFTHCKWTNYYDNIGSNDLSIKNNLFHLVADLKSKFKKCEPELWSLTIFSSLVPLVSVSAYYYYKYFVKDKKREERAETITSPRPNYLTVINELADGNNRANVEVVVDTAINSPRYSCSKYNG